MPEINGYFRGITEIVPDIPNLCLRCAENVVIGGTIWANPRVILHSQVPFGIWCIRFQFWLKFKIYFFFFHNKFWIKKYLVKTIWVKINVGPKRTGYVRTSPVKTGQVKLSQNRSSQYR